MKNYLKILGVLGFTAFVLQSCKNSDAIADGYGNFEATEITVSAENTGKLLAFDLEEGQQILKNKTVGYIDTIPLSLKRDQLLVSKAIIESKSKGVLSQINVLNAQLQTVKKDRIRIENLIKEHAATQKQVDDVNGQIQVLQQQIKSIEIQNAPVVNELKNVALQLSQIEDQLLKSHIKNPITGTVLVKYMEVNELATYGKPLYKIADLSTLQLRVYVSETQLASLKIGQKVTVKTDAGETLKSHSGNLVWIASEAEFTPKIIQTKEERVALVYAVKVNVKNDGSLKIGMPAEMWLK